jgi:steroid Delta-isomerase
LSLLEEHAARFNEGVRTGDWSRMLELMTDDVMLEFDGIPVGPFHGRDAVRSAYEAQPPDDEIVLLDGGPAYAWASKPDLRAGELRIAERDGRVAALTVVYERD